MNDLYYEDRNVAATFDFSKDVLRRALLNIYSKKFHPLTDIEENLFNEVWRIINHATDTKGDRKLSYTHTDNGAAFQKEIIHGNAVFSAFKVHRMGKDMARLLLDQDGNLKPFEQWSKDVQPIASHQVGSWLRTEYDTAVLRAHQAEDWRQFVREKDVLPNLKWLPSTSKTPGEDHRIFWGVVRPIDDKFWDEHRPGDRWNCKCDLTSTDEAPTPVPSETIMPPDTSQSGLRSNPGKSGHIFSDDHPYFPSGCSTCPFAPGYTNLLMRFFDAKRKKDCYKCRYIDKRIKLLSDPVYLAKRDYYDLKHNPEYRDVHIDKKSGGVRATHIGHNDNTGRREFFGGTMSGADLERECVELLFRAGHKVILCDESKELTPGERASALDMQLDGLMMDIKSVTGRGWYWRALIKKNHQLMKYNSRPDIKEPVQSLCLYFHQASMFNQDNLLRSINKYKHFYGNNGQRIPALIKRIYVVINGRKEVLQYDV